MKLLDSSIWHRLLIKKIIYIVIFIFSLSLSFLTINNNAEAAIVKCGIEKDNPATTENEAYEGRCTLCDLIIGIKDIIDWGRNILIIVALAIITIGGVVYIISAGNEQMMETAKHIIIQALWGTVIMLGAWLIVNTAMWLLAAKDSGSAEGGTLGLGMNATSWSEFNCVGERQGSVTIAAACSKDNKYECRTPGSSVINKSKDGYKYTWQCDVLGNKTNCEYIESVCSKTENCKCLSGDPLNCSGYSWTCKTANEEVACDATGMTPVCDEKVKYKCVSGTSDPGSFKFDAASFTYSWNCTGNGTESCSYVMAACNNSMYCECKSGTPDCSEDPASGWICETENEEVHCSP